MNGAGQDVAICTIVAKNYLAHARVLSKSLRAFHPAIAFFTGLTDAVDGYFSPASEPFDILRLDDIAIPQSESLRAQYSRKQFAAAAKPYLIAELLDRGFRSVLFLDPDILVLSDLAALIACVRAHNITLTPHLLTPTEHYERAERELVILKSGVFNAGVIGVSDTPAARGFLSWWKDRVHDTCRYALAEGIYYDQRWLDLVPVFFADVHVVRDRGVNVGHWNLAERDIQFDGEIAMTGDHRVRIFHFSGFDPDQDVAITRYSDKLKLQAAGPVAMLFRTYAGLLNTAGYQEIKSWPYAYHRGGGQAFE